MMRFFGLVTIGIYLGLSGNTLAETSRVIKGNCEEFSCEVLWQKLQTNYPEKTTEYLSDCPPENTLSLSVFATETQSKRVYLSCWQPKIDNGERFGEPLGTLPFPGYEKEFISQIANNDPTFQQRLQQNAEQLEKILFECETRGGYISMSLLEDQKGSVQCSFYVGVTLFDSNGDWISEGQYGMGILVDFIEELGNRQ